MEANVELIVSITHRHKRVTGVPKHTQGLRGFSSHQKKGEALLLALVIKQRRANVVWY